MTSQKVYFENLDGFRTIAFLLVFVQHALKPILRFISPENSGLYSFLRILFSQGENGVSFFFVLSGFLITSLLFNERESTGKISILNFYIRRTLRIWPLYFLFLLIALVALPYIFDLAGGEPPHPNEKYWYYWCYIANFDQLSILQNGLANSKIVSITWSIAIEEQFYLIWPVIIILFRKSRPLLLVIILLLLLSLAFRLFHYQEKWVLYLHSLSVGSDLFIGSLSALLVKNSVPFRKFIGSIGKPLIIIIYILGILVLCADKFYYFISATRLLIPCFFAFIIIEQNISSSSFYKMKNIKVLTAYGKYTYSLYLYHTIFILIAHTILSFILPEDQVWIYISRGVLALILIVPFSILIYRYFEKPILRFKDRFAKS